VVEDDPVIEMTLLWARNQGTLRAMKRMKQDETKEEGTSSLS
jgi:hypothetical protein